MSESAKWIRIFRKLLPDPTRWTKICDLPSDIECWRMYLIGLNGKPPVDAYVKIAHEDNPPEDLWYPVFAAVGNPVWNTSRPKAIYGQGFQMSGQVMANVVVVEVWLTKMPAKVGDKEPSSLGKLGTRQE